MPYGYAFTEYCLIPAVLGNGYGQFGKSVKKGGETLTVTLTLTNYE